MSARLLTVADATVPALVPAARRLGKYILTDVLGEGAMGVVYRALDPHIDRVVAIKTIRKSLLDTPTGNHSAALRFRNEARAAGRLSHPGIVAIHEYGEDGEQGFIVMEFVDGASLLRCTVPQQRLPLADVLSVSTQVLHALNHAHAHGVWHRDIKPSNLLVTPGGQLKITDFGIARVDATVLTQDATIMGSCGYMAPECYQGIELDQRVDLFACGVLLYELLTGHRPFKGIPGAVMHQLLHEEPPALACAACDAAEAAALAPFEPIVARAMAKDRARRYAVAQEMLDDLARAAGEPTPAHVSDGAVRGLLAPRPAVAAAARAPAWVHSLPRKPQPMGPAPASIKATLTVCESKAARTAQPTVGFETTLLATLASLLAVTLGPVARVVVRRAAAQCNSLADLVTRLANELPAADDRRGFLAQARQVFGAAALGDQKAYQTQLRTTRPAPVSTPLHEDAIQRAQHALTRHVGPIARVFVRRAGSKASSREHFIATLTALAADCIEPERLRAELEAAM